MIILTVNKFFWRKGGSEMVFFGEKEMLESAGHQVIPFSMESERNEPSNWAHHFVSEVDYSQGGLANRLKSATRILYSFESRRKMEELLDETRPDIAHFHIFQHQITTAAFNPLRRRNIPIVLTLHDLKPICPNYKMYTQGEVCERCKGGKFHNCFTHRCTKGSAIGSLVNTLEMYLHHALGHYSKVDRYIAPSRFYQRKMVEFGFPMEQVDYLPNYIDADAIDPTSDDMAFVLFAGRLSAEKGVDTLLEAARLTPHIHYRIAGSGPLEGELKAFAQQHALNNVQFLGFQGREQIDRLLHEAACVVLPSVWYENAPMTLLEALAYGKPVAASDIGGNPELVEVGQDGFVFPPKDASALAERLDWLWTHRKQARQMGMQGRDKVLNRFSPDAHYDGLMSIYRSTREQWAQ